MFGVRIPSVMPGLVGEGAMERSGPYLLPHYTLWDFPGCNLNY